MKKFTGRHGKIPGEGLVRCLGVVGVQPEEGQDQRGVEELRVRGADAKESVRWRLCPKTESEPEGDARIYCDQYMLTVQEVSSARVRSYPDIHG